MTPSLRTSVVISLLALMAPAGANAKARGARAAAPRAAATELVAERSAKSDRADKPASGDKADKGDAADTTSTAGKTIKTKTYTFGAMDVEGKLKTPQLLYFLNRVKLELDMSAPDKRSFMKELAKTAEDKSL
jgi:hypothetical protein